MNSLHINDVVVTKENANKYIVAYETSDHYATGVCGYSRTNEAYAPIDFFDKRKDAYALAKSRGMKTFFKKAPKKNIEYYGEAVGTKWAKIYLIKVKDFVKMNYLNINIIANK